MANLIDREEAIKKIEEKARKWTGSFYGTGLIGAVEIIRNIPATVAVKEKTGKWEPIEYDGYADGNPVWDLWECSECGKEHAGDQDTLTQYCPDCGAKMEVAYV